jgi:hypothetical protein
LEILQPETPSCRKRAGVRARTTSEAGS